jgi:hypothetical protein
MSCLPPFLVCSGIYAGLDPLAVTTGPVAVIAPATRGSYIFADDERGRTLFSKLKGRGGSDGLLGFTSSAVTMRFGSTIYAYGENGQTLYTKEAA